MIAIRRGRLHSAIVRFFLLFPPQLRAQAKKSQSAFARTLPRWKPPDAKSNGAVTSIRYGAACLLLQNAGLGQKFFELDARFVRLKGENRLFGAAARPYIAINCTAWCQVAPTGQVWKEIHFMRSDLVFGALSHVSNRYQLCQLASKATRKLHKPNTRLQDTTNEVLVRFRSTNPGTPAQAQVPAARPLEARRAA